MKTLGVVGGMGPQATIQFYQQVIDCSQSLVGAEKNDDYPHLLVSNLPVPDLIADQESEKRTVQMVKDEMVRLEQAGADLLVLPCNTMHLYQEFFMEDVHVPFLSMIDVVVDSVVADQISSVGILGSKTTMQSGLYQHPLEQQGVDVALPSESDQELVIECILHIIAGKANTKDHHRLQAVMNTLKNDGAEAIILGCTELPLLITEASIPLYKSLHILAETAFHHVKESVQ